MADPLDPRPAGDTQASGSWGALIADARRPASDRQVLAERLAHWARERNLEDAALYSEHETGYRRLASTGNSSHAEHLEHVSDAGGVVLELPGALLVAATDVGLDADDPKLLMLAAGVRIARLNEKIHQQRFQARFRSVELEALYEIGMAIGSTLDLEALAEEVLMRAIALLDAQHGALYLIEDGTYRLRGCIGGEVPGTLRGDDARIAAALGVVADDQGILIEGAAHQLTVPVEIDGAARGLLLVGDKESRTGVGPFPANDARILSLFANQAAIALENAKLHRLALEKERLEREMELAAEIQQQLLPKGMPEIEGFEVLGWNRPARQVGGDYFDVRALNDGRWLLVVGDVTGKGIPAALLVSTLHSALRLLPDTMPLGAELLSRMNRHIHEASGSNKFITLILVELDVRLGAISYLNGGHNPGILLRADGTVEELAASGLPLGLLPEAQFESRALRFEPGDLLCLYSDGITECATPCEEEYGQDRLVELLRAHRDAPLETIVAKVDDAVVDFAEGQPQGDDQTVILLRRPG